MDLFARSDCDYALLRQRLVDGAAQGVYLRTSSWKYPGWLGTVYDSPGNLGRGGMVSESQLDRTCLAEYAMLGSHGITHIYNSWSDKPAIGKQMALLGSLTNPECVGPRQLLKSGRKYQQAVDGSSPYARTQEMLPGVRRCGGAAVRRGGGAARAAIAVDTDGGIAQPQGYAVSSQIKLAVWRDAGSILECVWLATAFSSGLARVNFS